MNEKKFKNFMKEALQSIRDESGSILYSSYRTVQKNDIYLMGTNPGGQDGNSLDKNINNFFNQKGNAYLDEEWENKQTKYKKGQAPLQQRVQNILEGLGYNTRDVCATNLIFTQSRNLDELKFDFFQIADICWKVHLKLLSIIQPQIILVFGNGNESPYNYIKQKYQISNEYREKSGYSDWEFKSFQTKEYIIVGLPHLSYSINPEKAINFIKKVVSKKEVTHNKS